MILSNKGAVMIRAVWTALLAAGATAPLMAQQPAQASLATQISQTQPQVYSTPECELNDDQFMVKSGRTYIKSYLSAKNEAAKPGLLDNSERVILKAINEQGQGDVAGSWYWLGRVYLYRGDIAGADSALSKALAKAPGCKEPIDNLRKRAYAVLLKNADQMEKSGNLDSALALNRMAAHFLPSEPYAPQSMGVLYFEKKQYDSAAAAFEQATAAAEPRAATDSDYAKIRNRALFNLGAAYQNAGKPKEAAEAFGRFLRWSPGDKDVMKALATSLRASGQVDSAQKIESQMLSTIQEGGEAAENMSANDAFDLGVNAINDKKYDAAAQAFHKVLEKEPHNRGATFNLATAYYNLKNADSLTAVARRLVEHEPMNQSNLRLLAQGFQLNKQQDSVLHYVTALIGLPATIDISKFQPTGSGAILNAQAKGLQAQNATGNKTVPPQAFTLVFEFQNDSGAVVDSGEVQINALKPGETQAFNLEATGEGIVDFSYHRK